MTTSTTTTNSIQFKRRCAFIISSCVLFLKLSLFDEERACPFNLIGWFVCVRLLRCFLGSSEICTYLHHLLALGPYYYYYRRWESHLNLLRKIILLWEIERKKLYWGISFAEFFSSRPFCFFFRLPCERECCDVIRKLESNHVPARMENRSKIYAKLDVQ